MFGFSEMFQDTEALVFLVFILISLSVYSSGGSYADSVFINGLGIIKVFPLMLMRAIGGISPLLALICALAFLWLMGFLREFFGTPVYAVITFAAVVLLIVG